MKKNVSALLVIVACALSLLFAVGCAEMGGETGDTYKAVPKKVHETQFPHGHSEDLEHKCYYDERDGIYFCQFD